VPDNAHDVIPDLRELDGGGRAIEKQGVWIGGDIAARLFNVTLFFSANC
jgi:hypothetical protein